MASSIGLKKLVSSNLVQNLRLIRPAATAPSLSRFFNANAVREFDDGEDERSIDVDRRSGSGLPRRRGDLFADVFDPFSPTRTLSQLLNTMDQFMDNPFLTLPRGMGAGTRRGWEARETDDALNLRIDMPGLDKENVKVAVEQNTLVIKGEGPKEFEDDEESGRRYSSRIDLPEKIYNTSQIKAEMKNGVLKVTVPKVKEEERVDAVQVKVE
ncbi:hypothetical protein K2173_027287 [Erythroxylum novogranatense]|uniref:SHSP domain-containing protein n=1 Tax=Erythroxylum novogranatense TaxID=1862640 RepID=A0AAV8U243_9ROSI|nr:hypothetical protein K2173_027287 [Erythroxylum novogranatense]